MEAVEQLRVVVVVFFSALAVVAVSTFALVALALRAVWRDGFRRAWHDWTTLKLWALAGALVMGACGSEVTAPRLEYKEGARCYVVEVERPRRGAPTQYVNPCRPVR